MTSPACNPAAIAGPPVNTPVIPIPQSSIPAAVMPRYATPPVTVGTSVSVTGDEVRLAVAVAEGVVVPSVAVAVSVGHGGNVTRVAVAEPVAGTAVLPPPELAVVAVVVV